MSTVNVSGAKAAHAGVTYIFRSVEDAEKFKACVEGGGDPETCARQFHCISKKRASLGHGR
jgi:hypothetical protein